MNDITIFKTRRDKLSQQLPKACAFLLPAATHQYRNLDIEQPFRQNSDFFYLTGFTEPDALLVLVKEADGKTHSVLFNQAHCPETEIWTGKVLGADATTVLGLDTAHDNTEETLNQQLPKLFYNKQTIFYPIGQEMSWDRRVIKWLKMARQKTKKMPTYVAEILQDALPLLHEMRLIKTDAEVATLKQAVDISAAGHRWLMQKTAPGIFEYQLAAWFESYCKERGCAAMAYPSIVGGGKNGCTLHYTANNQQLSDNELVLIDAGAEYQYYAADITRTFPVNGKFSTNQRQLYDIVLAAQLAGIQAATPGQAWQQIQTAIVEVIVEGLLSLGILTGTAQELIENKAYKKYYMHSSGHWLGLDVHDVGKYQIAGKWRELMPNMVLTIEPGLYIPADDKSAWAGMGIRIEDDVLITKTGNTVLSAAVPKTIDEIEVLMAGDI